MGGGLLVVDEGKYANGEYTKYSDGTLIVRQVLEGTADVTKSWGNLYISNTITLPQFPVNFIEKPNVQIHGESPAGTQFSIITSAPDNQTTGFANIKSAGSCALCRPTSRTLDYRLFILSIGKWK